jgi:hypothetical protein
MAHIFRRANITKYLKNASKKINTNNMIEVYLVGGFATLLGTGITNGLHGAETYVNTYDNKLYTYFDKSYEVGICFAFGILCGIPSSVLWPITNSIICYDMITSDENK